MKITAEWLVQRVEEAPTSYLDAPATSPLRTRMAWQKLKSHAHTGDELWAFANPPGTWRKLGRQTGYAIVREGAIVEIVATAE